MPFIISMGQTKYPAPQTFAVYRIPNSSATQIFAGCQIPNSSVHEIFTGAVYRILSGSGIIRYPAVLSGSGSFTRCAIYQWVKKGPYNEQIRLVSHIIYLEELIKN